MRAAAALKRRLAMVPPAPASSAVRFLMQNRDGSSSRVNGNGDLSLAKAWRPTIALLNATGLSGTDPEKAKVLQVADEADG
jgi:hypothetical protein